MGGMQNCCMQFLESALIKREMGPSSPFPLSADWNVDMKAGTQAVILDLGRKSHVEAGGTR